MAAPTVERRGQSDACTQGDKTEEKGDICDNLFLNLISQYHLYIESVALSPNTKHYKREYKLHKSSENNNT